MSQLWVIWPTGSIRHENVDQINKNKRKEERAMETLLKVLEALCVPYLEASINGTTFRHYIMPDGRVLELELR